MYCVFASFYSLGGAAECTHCDSERQANAEQTGCEACPTGRAGYNGECNVCFPGQQPNDYTFPMRCVDCKSFGPSYHSTNGIQCFECPPGEIPDLSALAFASTTREMAPS
jgi:hypothetical protein